MGCWTTCKDQIRPSWQVETGARWSEDRSGPDPGVGYAADGPEMRSIESGGGGGGTGWALSCSRAYMVRDGEEPGTRFTIETTGRSDCI